MLFAQMNPLFDVAVVESRWILLSPVFLVLRMELYIVQLLHLVPYIVQLLHMVPYIVQLLHLVPYIVQLLHLVP